GMDRAGACAERKKESAADAVATPSRLAQPTRCGKAAGQLRQRFRSTFLPATQLKYDRFLRTKVYGVCGQLASLPCSTLTLEISGLPWRQGVGQVSNGDSQRGRHGHVRLPSVR